jgi:ATP-dependent DNA helicase RecG
MDIEQIRSLIKQGESITLEFKVSTAKLQATFATICAFLNGKGGTVLIGVKDKGQIIGQDVTDSTRLEIANEIKKIEPAASIDIDYVKIEEDKFVIAIHVNAADHAPYIYDGRAFQRSESQTCKMSQHRYEQLLVKRSQLNHSWETFIAEDYTIDDLDKDEIYHTIHNGITEKRIPASIAKESVEKILRQLKLMRDKKLKRAAVVLFGKETESEYPQCWLKMARFQGTDKSGNFIDNQQVYCNVFRMLEGADNFLRKHLPITSYFKPNQFRRIDKPVLPILAVREALVNAICHRDYTSHAGYVSMAIFDDRVEIWSNGTLPNELKIEDLKRKHDSVLRNKLIAKIFYLRGYIERWGTGTIKMLDLCKENAIPTPRFAERTGGFVVTFKFAEPIGVYKKAKPELTSRQREILKLLEKSEFNSVQLAKKLKGSPAVRTVQVDLLYLEKAGLVKREGKARAMVWIFVKDK